MRGDLPQRALSDAVRALKDKLAAAPKAMATRTASEIALESLIPALPEMLGGSADLTGSNNTRTKSMTVMSAADYSGRYIHYGIREHGMAAAMNGMALHGGIIPYGGTFLVFSDYCRPAIRLAALMGIRVIFVMTHDSIGLGEDGPTHQPVEHLAALRAIPNLLVFRPGRRGGDRGMLAAGAGSERPPQPAGAVAPEPAAVAARTFSTTTAAPPAPMRSPQPSGKAQVTFFATGSEVCHRGRGARSCWQPRASPPAWSPCPAWLLLEAPEAARRAIIGDATVKVGIEAAVRQGWDAIIGVGRRLHRHDISAPARPTRTFTSISASRPRQWRRPR